MYMDTNKKILIAIGVSSILAIGLMAIYLFINVKEIKNPEPKTKSVADSDVKNEEVTEEIDWNDLSEEDAYTINNSIEEIFDRVSVAENDDRVGKADGEEIYVFKYPELSTRSLLYSNSEIMVRYDDYVCVRYEPEKDNEKYILIVYYFDSNNMWESWYKYIFAKNDAEAEKLAKDEEDNGYAVWSVDNIVMVGEQFSEASITEEVFMNTLENKIIRLK